MAIKYHLGCGGNYFPGYINVDFPQSEHTIATVKADMYANLLEMAYEPCEEIRSHHVFEHFNYIESMALLIKWTRALQINGTIRIDLPNMEALSIGLAHAILDGNVLRTFRFMRMIYGSHEAKWAYHINGWTKTTMTHVLEKFGFILSDSRAYGDAECDFPNCGIDMSFKKVKEVSDLKAVCRDIFPLYAVESSLITLFNNLLDKLC